LREGEMVMVRTLKDEMEGSGVYHEFLFIFRNRNKLLFVLVCSMICFRVYMHFRIGTCSTEHCSVS
jgi:hypothetical protein